MVPDRQGESMMQEAGTRVVAVIPARGGSQGIPRKNLQRVGGLTLIARTVRAAVGSDRVDDVYVSSDSEEILDEARRHGARAIRRPTALGSASASSESALVHALETIEEEGGAPVKVLVFMQCTTPLTTSDDIDRAVAMVADGLYDSVFTATAFHYFVWRESPVGMVGANHDASVRQRRQDRPVEWLENGAVYVMKCVDFLRVRHRFFGRVGVCPMPGIRSIEIDDPDDLRMASLLAVAEGVDLPRHPSALFLDFDGVMTDNAVWVDQEGFESVRCSRSDGIGIALIRERGVPVLVVSSERNPVVSARCRKLGIEWVQAIDDKAQAIRRLADDRGFDLDQAVFLGNDVNDLPGLGTVGFPCAVADAYPQVMEVARFVTTKPGGQGAVRELCEALAQCMDSKEDEL